MGSDEFFREQQAAAVLKHAILQPWLHVFASKTGSRASDHRVLYLDGYAGPGTYSDGAPGSPALAAQTAENLAPIRNLEGHYVEARRRLCQELQDMLKGTDHEHYVYRGRVEEHLPTIIERAGDAPLFAFFDPFGLGIPLEVLTDQVLNRKAGTLIGGPTEVLVNFSLPGLRRNAGKKTQPKVLAKLDAMLGGPWWREVWDAGGR